MASKFGEEDRDAEFLAEYDVHTYERPSLAVDVVAVTVHDGKVLALLVKREEPPQKDRWALPGGFVGIDESLDLAAERVLADKAGVTGVYLEQLYTFGSPARDPRTRVVSVTYMALVDHTRLEAAVSAQPDACRLAELEVAWPGEMGGPASAIWEGDLLPVAFDHSDILGTAVLRLRGKLDYAPVGFELLPDLFTLRQLQNIHEAILGRRLNKDSFRRKVLSRGQVEATGLRQENVAYRPAELYKFAQSGSVPSKTEKISA